MKTYIHTKTGNEYVLIDTGKMKVGPQWIECAIYTNDKETFVRDVFDFDENFKIKTT